MDKETPITKYLATLERRQAQRNRDFLFGSPGPSPESKPISIRQQLRFEDETFLQPHDQSIQQSYSPTASNPIVVQTAFVPKNPEFVATPIPNFTVSSTEKKSGENKSGPNKRKRYSFEEREEEEDRIKKICELQKLLRLTNAELVEARSIISKVEKQQLDLRREICEKALNYEKSMSEMRIRTRDAEEKAFELEKNNESKEKQMEELKDELRRQAHLNTENAIALENKVSQLECQNVELKQQYEEEKAKQNESLKEMAVHVQESELGSEKWFLECQILTEKLALKESQLAKYMQERKAAQSKNKCLEAEPNTEDSDTNSTETGTPPQLQALMEEIRKYENLYVKEQSEKRIVAQKLSKVTEENRYLRGSMSKELLLEEQISSLEAELKQLRVVSKLKNDLEMERDALKEKLCQWTDIAQNISAEFVSPHKFRLFLCKMQSDQFEMKHDNTSLSCRIDSLNCDLNKLKSDYESVKQIEVARKDELDKLATENKQLNRRLLLLTKDRDGLKALKESYEQELEGIISTGLKNRVDQLEALVREYELIVDNDPSANKTKCFECEKRIALISELRSELETVRNAYQDATFANLTMTGNGNTTGIKIVAFGNNPSSLSLEDRVKELCSENDKLQNRIKYLEDQSGPSDTLVIQGNKIVEEELRTMERKYELLQQAYEYETQQFQTALSKLFGFHVNLVREPQSQIRLQSVLATGLEDEFIFHEAEDGDMVLLETAVLNNFREEIDRYLLRDGSIPAFLANVTIALCNVRLQSSDVSQLPCSQQSTAESGVSVTVDSRANNRNMVEVQVGDDSDRGSEDEDEEMVEEEEEPEEDDNGDEDQHSDYDDEDDDDEEEEFRHARKNSPSGEEKEDVVCIDSD